MNGLQAWRPCYVRRRAGGWFVTNIHHPAGGLGGVSNAFPDKKWRILACVAAGHFRSRDEAAYAERGMVLHAMLSLIPLPAEIYRRCVMPETIYACTHVIKEVAKDDYEKGCDVKRSCTLDEKCNITARTLPALLAKIQAHFGLEDLLDAQAGLNGMGWLEYCRTENAYCLPPTLTELELFKTGSCPLFVCDYSFKLEKRVVEELSREEFEAAGVRVEVPF